mmetsp:Transcript_97551/g.157320  ORF Transcript_97551/g.157320 Transcript_97551/m.157320 type:complete len:126 (+) Transcript_97551:46-423(+)|eukprot:CAMPEP_0179445578 /NCGR_PEP_ID=MMETSP0799-20121207/28992_1 /TAXON_ID=46947 /ORGANISM="Geminigera cryophila, Strain CCMP2564" /LENGTH=125 /DNA_ID=CAMNT_0021233697 /DNA_START=1492 /DNA_END=1869 /DNA_ORIENTATION=-
MACVYQPNDEYYRYSWQRSVPITGHNASGTIVVESTYHPVNKNFLKWIRTRQQGKCVSQRWTDSGSQSNVAAAASASIRAPVKNVAAPASVNINDGGADAKNVERSRTRQRKKESERYMYIYIDV